MEPVELFTPEFQQDLYPAYRILRERHPVYRDPRTDAWMLSRYDDVYGALADHETFSSEHARGGATSGSWRTSTGSSTGPPPCP